MNNIKKILITPLLVMLAVIAVVFTGEVQAAPLTPADFPDLKLPSLTVKSNSIRRSNEYLMVKIEDHGNAKIAPFSVIELTDCAGSRSKTIGFNGTQMPAEQSWRFVYGSTMGSEVLDHVCDIGRKTGLIK